METVFAKGSVCHQMYFVDGILATRGFEWQLRGFSEECCSRCSESSVFTAPAILLARAIAL